jgi:putative flippase GtrA
MSREAVRFALVGVSNTAISMAVYVGLLAIGVWYLIAVVVSYAAGLANGYTLNRVWSFAAGSFSVGSLARYVTVQLAGLCLSVGLTALFVERLGWGEVPALVASWPPVIAMSFLATRLWVFGPSRRS